MRISDLYSTDLMRGQDVFVIGTGPSLGLYPPEFFNGRFAILLNDCCRYLPDAGPIAFTNNRKFLKWGSQLYKIVKGRLRFDPHPERHDNHVPWGSPDYYVFSYRDDRKKYGGRDDCSHFDWSRLWLEPDFYINEPGGSVSIFAAQFAAQCGARSIQLVGCDCCEFGDLKYVASKKPRPEQVHHDYDAYSRGMLRLKYETWKRFGIPIVSVQPFVGLGRHEEQFSQIKEWPT